MGKTISMRRHNEVLRDLEAMRIAYGSVADAEARLQNRIHELNTAIGGERQAAAIARTEAIPMRLNCPECGELHIDEGAFATKPHHTHACQACGMVWRPAVRNTVGVRFLPGYKGEPAPGVVSVTSETRGECSNEVAVHLSPHGWTAHRG
jgi:predicted RNA-binding Zn-ribbon protein involved in translation (DUF1610 family)